MKGGSVAAQAMIRRQLLVNLAIPPIVTI